MQLSFTKAVYLTFASCHKVQKLFIGFILFRIYRTSPNPAISRPPHFSFASLMKLFAAIRECPLHRLREPFCAGRFELFWDLEHIVKSNLSLLLYSEEIITLAKMLLCAISAWYYRYNKINNLHEKQPWQIGAQSSTATSTKMLPLS